MKNAKDKIKDEFIRDESKYVDTQFDNVEMETITNQDMDIPFIYDGQEFLIAVYNRKPLESLKVELASESNTTIGLYSENDPEFLVLRANILTKGQFITSFAFKAPYLEAVEFQCLGIESLQSEGMYYYFLHMKAELSCFGNGNLNNEFALNQYNDLLFKFRTKYANGKLSDEQSQFIENAFTEKILITMEGFLTQLDGSPRLLYLMNIFKAILEDANNDAEAQNKVAELYSNFLLGAYNDLTSIESLTKIAFDDIDDIIVQIEEIMQQSHYNIASKYDIQLTDSVGNPIDINDAKNMRDNLINLEQNYNLHGDYLYFIYNESRQMNQEFSMMQYEDKYKANEEEVN